MARLKTLKKQSRADYEGMLRTLEKKGRDGFGLLGDGMITALGVAGGALSAGAIAGAAGATTTVFTTVASWVGITAVAATPVGWVAGCAAAGGGLAYGISRMVRSGGKHDEKRAQLGEAIRQKIAACENEANQDTDEEQFKNVIRLLLEAHQEGSLTQKEGTEIVAGLRERKITPGEALEILQKRYSG